MEWLTDAEVLKEAVARYGDRRRRHPRLAEWSRRLAEVEQELEYNLRAAREGAIDLDVLVRANRPLLEEKQRLLDRLREEQARPMQEKALKELVRCSARSLVAELRHAPVDRQIAFLRRIFTHGELLPGRVRLHFAHPDLPPLVCGLPRFYAPTRGCDRFPEPYFEAPEGNDSE